MDSKSRMSAKVLYPRKQDEVPLNGGQDMAGGTPIVEDLAVALRCLVFGSSTLPGPTDLQFISSSFVFHPENTVSSWRLKVPPGSGRAVCACVQALVLKHLLFVSRTRAPPPGDYEGDLRVCSAAQHCALVSAFSDALWLCGGARRCAVLCATQRDALVANSARFIGDGVTERIVCFNFKKQEELTSAIQRCMREYTGEDGGGGGLLLLLYSALLSRGLDRVREDLVCSPSPPLLPPSQPPHTAVAGLLLTGRCSPYMHNGSANVMGKQVIGVTARSDVGFLAWSIEAELTKKKPAKVIPAISTARGKFLSFGGRGGFGSLDGSEDNDEDEEESRRINANEVNHQLEAMKLGVGSRLKTPMYPVWVTLCNDTYGLLFHPNKELTRDYHAENRFELLYVSTSTKGQDTSYLPQRYSQSTDFVEMPALLTVDTRSKSNQLEGKEGRQDEQGGMGASLGGGGPDFPTRLPPLVNLLHTKWQDADVSWNGDTPHV